MGPGYRSKNYDVSNFRVSAISHLPIYGHMNPIWPYNWNTKMWINSGYEHNSVFIFRPTPHYQVNRTQNQFNTPICNSFWYFCKFSSLPYFFSLRGLGGLDLGMGKIEFDAVFDRDMQAIRYFSRNQKILLVAKVISFSICENTCNYITRANFNRDFLKMVFFQLQINKAFTVFKLEL